jgi:hypothetical protein
MRIHYFLSNKKSNWNDSNAKPEFWPKWAKWGDPKANSDAVNKEIVLAILRDHGRDIIGSHPIKAFWPPFPKPFAEFDLSDVVIYIRLVVFHLSGYKPDLSNPDHKPAYWGQVWGLQNVMDVSDPSSSANWIADQKRTIERLMKSFGPTEGVSVDLNKFLLHFNRSFQYLGSHQNQDLIAIKNLKTWKGSKEGLQVNRPVREGVSKGEEDGRRAYKGQKWSTMRCEALGNTVDS